MRRMDGNEYAVSNLRILAENISAYASYASENLNDPYNDLYDRAKRAQKAVRCLANWIEKNKKL